MSLVSSARIEGIRRKNEFSCFCQLVTLLSPLLRAGMCWPLFPLHHGSVGSFWEVVAGFINSASCLLGQACSQLFFFPVFFLAFCGRLVRRSFLGAPPPPRVRLPLSVASTGSLGWGKVSGITENPSSDPVFQAELFSENFEGFESKLGF